MQNMFMGSCHKIFHVFRVHALKNVGWEHPTCSETALSWQCHPSQVNPKGHLREESLCPSVCLDIPEFDHITGLSNKQLISKWEVLMLTILSQAESLD